MAEFTLQDFNPTQETRVNALEQFASGNTGKRVPPFNDQTMRNAAAHAAMLTSPDKLLDTFSRVSNELRTGNSPTLDTVVAANTTAAEISGTETLRNVLTDDTVSQEDKVAYLEGWTKKRSPKSLGYQVAVNGAIAPSEATDNAETEWVRPNVVRGMDEVDAFNGWVQQQANTIRTATSTDGNTFSNILEMVIPFMEGAALAKTKSLLGASGMELAKGIALLGESKADLRSAVAKMPIAQRAEFAKELLKVIQQSGGSVTDSPNTMLMINQLNDTLVSGAYGDGWRLLDDISSLMDLTILTAPAWRGAKEFLRGVSTIGKTSSTLATTRRAEAAAEALTPVVEDIIVQAVPVTPLDNIINSLPGMDKATSEEFAQARNAIGHGLEDGLSVDEIISNTLVFDKMTADEIMEARRVLSETNPGANAPLPDDIVQAVRDLVSDHIVGNMEQLDLGGSKVFADVRKTIADQITNTTLRDPNLPKTIIAGVKSTIKEAGLPPMTTKQVRQFKTYIEAESAVARRTVRTDVDFSSASQRIKDTNPRIARAMHEAVVADTSGDVAQSTYGTTRAEAIANDLAPEVAEAGGSVRSKVAMPSPDEELIAKQKKGDGASWLGEQEKETVRNQVKADFEAVMGLYPRRAMNGVGNSDTPTGVSINQVFGPKDGGFQYAQEGLDSVLFALRKYGLKKSDVEVLARDSKGEYSPVDKLTGEAGDYLVRVKYDYEFAPTDVVSWMNTDAGLFTKLFSSFRSATRGHAGSATQHVIPFINSMDTVYSNFAAIVGDKAASYRRGLENLALEYARRYKALDAGQKNLVTSYIIKANAERLPFDPLKMKAYGMDADAVETMRAWKKTQDTSWHFENTDLNKTLRSRGWERFVDQAGDSNLIARRVGKGALKRKEQVLDENGKLVELSNKQIDELYEKGGTLAQLRRPLNVEDDVIEHIVVKDSSEAGYLRRIRDDDTTLNYIDGHYSVRYKNPYFVVKQNVQKGTGQVFERAVANVGSAKEMDLLIKRLKTTDPEGVYLPKMDAKKNPQEFEDLMWDDIVSGGRSAQRMRGKRLADATGISDDYNVAHLETPEESLVNSIQSLAVRMAERDFLEAAKKRWLNQFGSMLQGANKGKFPDDVRMLDAARISNKTLEVGNAKATWQFINGLDNGYINLIDDFSKAFFNDMATTAGRSDNWGFMEKPLLAAGAGRPTKYLRKKAFRLLLASNPAQLAVQMMQLFPTIAFTNPLFMPKLANQIILLRMAERGVEPSLASNWLGKVAGLSVDEAKEMADAWKASGFQDAIDADSFLRDDLKQLTYTKLSQKIQAGAAVPINIIQKYGYQLGENTLMKSVWLSEYDLLKRSGKKIDASSLELMAAKVRHMTGNMNKGGELPYQENSFSFLMQFFQAPHKAVAMMLGGHKGLGTATRLKLATGYVLTFGIGANWVTDQIDKLIPDNYPGKGFLKDGFFNLLFNKTLSTLFHADINVDVSDRFRLASFPDMTRFVTSLMELNLVEAVTSNPSIGLVFGNNPRITQFVKEAIRPFMVPEARDAKQLQTTAIAFFSMFTGMSNVFKGMYALQHGQAMGTTGKINDFEVSAHEAILKGMLGVSTVDEILGYNFNDLVYRQSGKARDDIKYLINETNKHLALEGISREESIYVLGQLAEAQRVFKNDPYYMKIFQDEILNAAGKGNNQIVETILRVAGMGTKRSDMLDILNNSGLDKETTDKLKLVIDTIGAD